MAERRMFSKRIINSARFLKMPVSTQLLYFHLGLHADDDGIVEAYTIMNYIGATEDDLKILVAKNFVVVLNEDLVSYIVDWKENNKIRADRKVDSIYKDLLVQILPDVEIQQKKQRADVAKKLLPQGKEEIEQKMDDQWTSSGQPMDGIGKDRIGKDRIVKDNIPYEKIIDLFHSLCPSFPKVMKLTESRKKTIKARYNEYGFESFETLFSKAESSDFLKGINSTGWKANFDWLINPNNMVKVLEDTYKNKTKAKNPNANIDWNEWDKKNNTSELDTTEIDKLLEQGEIF